MDTPEASGRVMLRPEAPVTCPYHYTKTRRQRAAAGMHGHSSASGAITRGVFPSTVQLWIKECLDIGRVDGAVTSMD